MSRSLLGLGIAVGLSVASVLAAAALATTNTYCSGCSISTSGRVSMLVNGIEYNHISVTTATGLELYTYGSGVMQCEDDYDAPAYSLGYTCTASINPSQAHCEILSGPSVTGTCWDDYYGSPALPTMSGNKSTTRVAGQEPPALGGIAAANRPTSNVDAMDAGSVAMLSGDSTAGVLLVNSARAIGTIEGDELFVVPTTTGKLCVVLQDTAYSCAEPLTANSPLTFDVLDPDGAGGSAPLAFGVARDGITHLNADIGSDHAVIQVHQNVFAYRGTSAMTPRDLLPPSVASR